jgi:hypothetical protein
MKIAELTHSKLEIALKNVKLGQSRDKRVWVADLQKHFKDQNMTRFAKPHIHT